MSTLKNYQRLQLAANARYLLENIVHNECVEAKIKPPYEIFGDYKATRITVDRVVHALAAVFDLEVYIDQRKNKLFLAYLDNSRSQPKEILSVEVTVPGDLVLKTI